MRHRASAFDAFTAGSRAAAARAPMSLRPSTDAARRVAAPRRTSATPSWSCRSSTRRSSRSTCEDRRARHRVAGCERALCVIDALETLLREDGGDRLAEQHWSASTSTPRLRPTDAGRSCRGCSAAAWSALRRKCASWQRRAVRAGRSCARARPRCVQAARSVLVSRTTRLYGARSRTRSRASAISRRRRRGRDHTVPSTRTRAPIRNTRSDDAIGGAQPSGCRCTLP